MRTEAYILDKSRLGDLVEALKVKGEVIAPTNTGTDIQYLPVSRASEIDFSSIPLDSPKEYVFPITETMMEIEGGKITPVLGSWNRVLFGLRPCDVAAFQCMLRFFEDYAEEKIPDPYFIEKMEKLTVVAYNCPEPKEHCFCAAMGTGPIAESGFDLVLTDLGASYLVEAGSVKGEEILGGLSLPEASQSDISEKEAAAKRCSEKMNPGFDVQGIEDAIEQSIDAVAEKHGDRCIACGGCNFFCPTCTCFNVTDTVEGELVRRERYWDSCMLQGFTWLAGMGPERATPGSRMKQRLMHKLSYTKEHYGAYSCTGCGRCSQVCPSYIFMEDVIRDILRGV